MLTELSIGIQGLTQATFGNLWSKNSQVKLTDTKVNFLGKMFGCGMPNTATSQQRCRTFSPLRFVWIASLLFGVRGQRTDPFPAQIELSSIDGTNGIILNGEAIDDSSGYPVSSAGDMNGDGLSDLVVGASLADPSGRIEAGKSYVVYGRRSMISGGNLELSTLNGLNGFILNGDVAGDRSGFSVSNIGDMNGDGLGDIVIGAHGATPSGNLGAGKSYVIFGSKTPVSGGQFELSNINAQSGIVLNGEAAGDNSGFSVSSAGDLNGDGISDVVIGARYASPLGRSQAGKGYVVFGSRTSLNDRGNFDLSSLDGKNGFILNGAAAGERTGRSVSSAGDVNGDGISDLLICAYYASPLGRSNAGKVYVLFGSRTMINGGILELSSLNGTNGFIIYGVSAGDYTGRDTSSAGDMNGDGLSDIVISAHLADLGGRSNAGKSYVVYGSRTPVSGGIFELSSLNGNNGFILNGENGGDQTGRSVSLAGDVNGDGLSDIVIGAINASPPGRPGAGKSYVVFGSRTPVSGGTLELSSLNGRNGFILNGETAGDDNGISVSSAGDVNGDGLSDLAVGARFADPSGKSGAGKSYVVFGRKVFQPASTISTPLITSKLFIPPSTPQQSQQTQATPSINLSGTHLPSFLSSSSSTLMDSDTIISSNTRINPETILSMSNGQLNLTGFPSYQTSQSTTFSHMTSIFKSLKTTAFSSQLNSDTPSTVIPIVLAVSGVICISGVVVAGIVFRKCRQNNQKSDCELNQFKPTAKTDHAEGDYQKIIIMPEYDVGNLNADDYDSVRSVNTGTNTNNLPNKDYIEIKLSH